MKKTKAALALALPVVAGVLVLGAGTAQADPTCITNVTTEANDGVLVREYGGQAVVEGGVVKFTLPSDNAETPANEKLARVRWTLEDVDVPLSTFTSLTYKTNIISDGDNGFAAPAARLHLNNNKTLVFEPYWNGTIHEGANIWETWEVKATSKLWDEPGDAEPEAADTLANWKLQFPNAVVTGISIGLGNWNPGAVANFKEVEFVLTVPGTCPSTTPTTGTPTTPASTAPAVGGAAGPGELVVTGVDGRTIGIAGAGALVLGVLALLLGRRKRETEPATE